MNRLLILACLFLLAVVPNPTCTPAPVKITPDGATLSPGEQVQFTAELREGSADEIHWFVLRGPGTITETGLYRAPDRIPHEMVVTIRANLISKGENEHGFVDIVLRPGVNSESDG